MGLSEDLLRGVYAYGFVTPSPIQQQGVPALLSGRDCLLQAQSGSGKTATFAIAALQRLQPDRRYCQTLLLAPTRELAQQTERCVLSLCGYMGVGVVCCVGGKSVRDNIEALRRGAQVAVGTPGRVLDLLGKGVLEGRGLEMLVLDEADQMLDMGFQEQVKEIISEVASETQVALLSATMSPDVLQVTTHFMREPLQVLLKQDQLTLEGILQHYVYVGSDRDKLPVLLDLYHAASITQTIIFVNSVPRAERLSEQLNEQDYTVSCIHSGLGPQEREHVMHRFRVGDARVLVATDVLARGIDVQQVSMVVNFDVPSREETYLHRIGRSGRHGRKGMGISLVADEEVRKLRNIEVYYSTHVSELPSDFADKL